MKNSVIFFGDSICYGQYVSPNKIWIVKIANELARLGKDLWINNIAHSGDTTRVALEKMPFDVQSHGADIFYTQFGMNDCTYWQTDQGVPRVSKKAFEANLLEIIERARIFGAQKVLLGTNHISSKTEDFGFVKLSYQDSNSDYNDVIRQVADKTDSVLIDHEKSFEKEIEKGIKLDELLLDDQIHLSEKGHNIYYNTVFPIIQKYVEEVFG